MQGLKLPGFRKRHTRINLTKRFYSVSAVTALVLICHLIMGDTASFTYKGDTYDQESVDKYDRGQIVEYTNQDDF